MGFLKKIFGSRATIQQLPAGSITVDRQGRIVTSTVSSSFPRMLLQAVGQDVMELFQQARTAQTPLSEISLHYSSLRTLDLWRYVDADGGGAVRLKPYQVSNSASQLMLWVKAGLGVTLLPAYITGEMLQSGDAELVLPEIDWGTTLISALMPQGRGTPRRVRTLVDFLMLKFHDRIA